MGKRMEDHLRFAVAYWHSFAWPGGDPFGGQTFERPWWGETMDGARLKADIAFEMFEILACRSSAGTMPTSAPKARPLPRAGATSTRSSPSSRRRWRAQARGCLWGTANLFSNRRFMSGAATNPDPDVFAYGRPRP